MTGQRDDRDDWRRLFYHFGWRDQVDGHPPRGLTLEDFIALFSAYDQGYQDGMAQDLEARIHRSTTRGTA